jgi:hypothetical protein
VHLPNGEGLSVASGDCGDPDRHRHPVRESKGWTVSCPYRVTGAADLSLASGVSNASVMQLGDLRIDHRERGLLALPPFSIVCSDDKHIRGERFLPSGGISGREVEGTVYRDLRSRTRAVGALSTDQGEKRHEQPRTSTCGSTYCVAQPAFE